MLTQDQLLQVLGKRYEAGCFGPDAFDCWGLCWYIKKHFEGVTMPLYQGCDESMLKRVKTIEEAQMSRIWKRQESFNLGDIAIIGNGKRFEHVAYVLSDKLVIHVCASGSFVKVDKISDLARIHKSILSYRYEGPSLPSE